MGLLRFAKSVGTKIFGATETAACPAKVESPPLSAALRVMIAIPFQDMSAGRLLSQG
jgi:hypothetical protein